MIQELIWLLGLKVSMIFPYQHVLVPYQLVGLHQSSALAHRMHMALNIDKPRRDSEGILLEVWIRLCLLEMGPPELPQAEPE